MSSNVTEIRAKPSAAVASANEASEPVAITAASLHHDESTVRITSPTFLTSVTLITSGAELAAATPDTLLTIPLAARDGKTHGRAQGAIRADKLWRRDKLRGSPASALTAAP
jgi:hypothetical protein